MAVSWEYFVRRNNINVASFLKKHGCVTHDDLCRILNKQDIVPPERAEIAEHLPPSPRKPPPQRRARLGIKKPKPSPKKSTPKKTPEKKKEVIKEVKDDSEQSG